MREARLAILIVSVCAALVTPCAPLRAQPDYEKRSPFEAVRWVDSVPEILLQGRWYRPTSIDGHAVADIIEFCRTTWGETLVTKRFEEDLEEALTRMGTPPRDTVRLVLKDGDGREATIDAPMTKENRRRLWRAAQARETGRAARGGAGADAIPRAQAEAAVDALASLLVTSHSYSHLPRVDGGVPPAERAKRSLGDLTAPVQLETVLFGLIAPTGDGHASVQVEGASRGGAYLPFLPVPVGTHENGRVAAIRPDRIDFVDPEHPYLVAIDGVEIDRWLNAGASVVAVGSPQLVRERSCRALRDVGGLAPLILHPARSAGDRVVITLEGQAGASRTMEVVLSGSKPIFGDWPRTHSRIIRHALNIGYLRVPEMNEGPEFEQGILAALDGFQACDGLVIDVRGNGGGSRDLIHILGSRLLPPASAPVVYNASRSIRLPGESPEEMDGRMASRFLFRADHPRWSAEERETIGRFVAEFKPEVVLPDDRFGPWYVAVVSPAPADALRPVSPVVVLMDSVCFSATDVFLTAMRLMPGVTLLGEPSAGGSGLKVGHDLTIPAPDGGGRPLRIEATLSSMVSFTTDGRLFDTHGIQPHVVTRPVPTDFILGGTDTQLDAAIDRIAGSANPGAPGR